MISPSRKPLPDNTQHPQQTDIHAVGAIRTYNLSRRAAVDPRLKPRGHWDRREDGVANTVTSHRKADAVKGDTPLIRKSRYLAQTGEVDKYENNGI